MKKINLFLIPTLILLSFFTFTLTTFADNLNGGSDQTLKPVTIDNPLKTDSNGDPTVQTIIGRIINATMGLVGSLALAMFIYGGFVWMLAAGNEQNVQKGKGILTWATIGLIVIFSSYALVKVIFSGLGVE